jgi:two-component system repressor protein LuxO
MLMLNQAKVVLVEDTASLAATYRQYLRDEPIELIHVENGEDAKSAITQHNPKLVLLDLKLPDISGQEVLAWIREQGFPTAVVVMTAHSSVEIAVDVMRYGAEDFLEKPFDAHRLQTTVRNALKRGNLQSLVKDMEDTFERKAYHGFIGHSLPMQAVYRIIDAAAPSKATVFITGESGTGKEVCAEAIHKAGKRAKGPFIALNCGAIPRDLMESEIFGHTKGAFTGAGSERKGAAELADGGTLFLDEIGEMDLDLQTKLLRFVQTGRFQKVGSSAEQSVDVRFVCATNRDPYEEVAAGRFREDLFYRLHVVPVQLPPLRDRDDDIIAIAEHFLRLFAEEEGKDFRTFAPLVEVIFRRYPWPGNVRQLQNVIRNIVVLQNGETVTPEHLPPPLDKSLGENELVSLEKSKPAHAEQAVATTSASFKSLATVEREAIESAIAFCDGNIPKAAALLEISPSTIYRKKQSWEESE